MKIYYLTFSYARARNEVVEATQVTVSEFMSCDSKGKQLLFFLSKVSTGIEGKILSLCSIPELY